MSPLRKLLILVALSLGVLCAACALGPVSELLSSGHDEASAAAAKQAPALEPGGKSLSAQAAEERRPPPGDLTAPMPWARPPLSQALRPSKLSASARAVLPSKLPDATLRRPMGAYAMLEANQIGEPHGALSGWLDASLMWGYSLARQATNNRAIVWVPEDDLVHRAHFKLETDGPGLYVVALHLRNMRRYEVRVRNLIRGHRPGDYRYGLVDLVDETSTIPPGKTLILSVLFPTERGEPHRSLDWKTQSLTVFDGAPSGALLSVQAVTADKLPIR